MVFAALDHVEHPVKIVETGTLRTLDNWEGDGQSTILFDNWTAWQKGGRVVSIDLDGEACALARRLTSSRVAVFHGGSVQNLEDVAALGDPVDLLYLDSGNDPALILSEFEAALPALRPGSIVLVDDSPIGGVADYSLRTDFVGKIEGKGRLLAARLAGAPFAALWFCGYQVAWRIV